jgi:UDP-N-acetylglucosamine 2-epimerase
MARTPSGKKNPPAKKQKSAAKAKTAKKTAEKRKPVPAKAAAKAEEKSCILQILQLEPKTFVLATIHRSDNTDDFVKLKSIMDALKQISRDSTVILPLHPRTKKRLEKIEPVLFDQYSQTITFIEPLGYLDMVMLEKHASVIITDSGGVQKEAYFHGVPCITVRDETEWIELVATGANCLAGTQCDKIINEFQKMKDKVVRHKRLYGNGDSAGKIVKHFLELSSGA